MQARWGSHGDYEIIAISPNSPQECFDLTITAFNLSEKWRVPVCFMMDECVGHMTEKVVIPESSEIGITPRKYYHGDKETYRPFKFNGCTDIAPMIKAGDGYYIHITGLTHDERGYPVINAETQDKNVRHLVDKIRENADKIWIYEEDEIDYDLLVIVPTVMGSEVIERSEMGDEFNFVPTDPHTLQHKNHENIFVIGDAADVPTSKAGSVAHFAAETLFDNIMRFIDGRPLTPSFDGHANCFIESGFGKGLLIDFNYDVEPLPGKFPLPGVGPYSLLEETRMNHWGKMMFRWMYWNLLLKGAELPIEAQMNMAGKRQ